MEKIDTAVLPSPLGPLCLAAAGGALIGLWLQKQRFFGAGLPPDALCAAAPSSKTAPLRAGEAWLQAYFAGERPDPSALPLAPRGSAFRQLIWNLLCTIPYGTVVTYGDLAREAARRLGKPQMAAQAVGGAVGHNPIAIVIPCHRVVGAHGELTGYAGGMEKKRWLLHHEGADLAALRDLR